MSQVTITSTKNLRDSTDSKSRVADIHQKLCELQRQAELRRLSNKQVKEASKSLREEFFEGIDIS